jgi:hypothetical protein
LSELDRGRDALEAAVRADRELMLGAALVEGVRGSRAVWATARNSTARKVTAMSDSTR